MILKYMAIVKEQQKSLQKQLQQQKESGEGRGLDHGKSFNQQEHPVNATKPTFEDFLTNDQHGVDAEDYSPLQDLRIRDPVLPSQMQYSVEAAEMEVIQLPGLVRVDGPGLRSVKECRQDDSLVHLQFGVQVNTLAIPHGGLQLAEDLTSFGDPLGNLVIDSRVA
ncbi:unnamed protein product [Schistocephalus solidus]|uniref:Kinesin motor domain-containing protein n=1 Tax=Schistocephalus solidus TaxID=70667 RepID=A0A183SIV9_SCHSO|nr:unnamed protein product [Schistocephalus solidus]